MADKEDIRPGFITPQAAIALQVGFGQAMLTDMELQRDTGRALPVDEFPAKITAYDATTGSCSWTKQSYDSSGARIDHPTGVTGSPTSMPAFPVGNGVMPPTAFPVEVWMRRRNVTSTLSTVYEFDWTCACVSTGSGSGSAAGSGGTTLTDCCPSNAIPNTVTATLNVTFGTCTGINGVTITLHHFSLLGNEWWYGTSSTSCGNLTIQLTCNNDVPEFLIFLGGTSMSGVTTISGPIVTCSPLSIQWLFSINNACCGPAQFTVTITA